MQLSPRELSCELFTCGTTFGLQDAPESWEADGVGSGGIGIGGSGIGGSGIGGSAMRGGSRQTAYSERTMQSLEVRRRFMSQQYCNTWFRND